MGNTQTQQKSGSSKDFSISSFEKNYTLLKETHDPRFGPIKLFKTKTKPKSLIMVVTKSSLDSDYSGLIRDLDLRSKLRHENICQILGYSEDNLQKLCGSSNNLTIYSEFEKNTLAKEIEKKRKSNVILRFYYIKLPVGILP